ncbi:MAG: substrate-binding domain-containing protein [Anaerolineae bacterium]|nr:substrate-binding domain-containing protein [Anaerolineae bacterium]
MPYFHRRAWLTILALLLLAAPLTALAQDDAIRIDGSRIVADIIAPVGEALEANLSLEISGTSSGLSRLCSGEVDIANAARAITADEIEACAANDIEWVEVLVGYDALAVISNPAITATQCMTVNELTTLFGPGATDAVTALNQVNPMWGAAAIQAYAPPADNPAFNLLDSILPGDGLRADFNTPADVNALIGAVAENADAIGFAPLSAALASDAEVSILGVDNLSGSGCVAPDLDTLADGSYPAANGLYLYVNAESLARENVQTLVSAVIGDEGQAAVDAGGFVRLSDTLAGAVSANVADVVTGRQFSQPEPLYTIPLDVSGTVTVEAASGAYAAINALTGQLSSTYTGLTANVSGLGNPSAYQALCSGAADAAAVTRPPTAEEAALCEASGASLWEAPLGARALVMVVPEAAEFAACLTTDQVTTLWKAEGGEAATNWNEIDTDFPDLPVTIFLPLSNRSQTGFLLSAASDSLHDTRRDALQERNDALWRAAATANVEGAVTYMTLAEYEASDAAVQLVAVDAGAGCVEPSVETILDGSYAISEPVTFAARLDALARPEVKALAWFAVRSSSPALFEGAGLVSVPADSFTAYQESLIAAFEAAESAPAVTPVEDTPAEEAPAEETPAEEAPAEEESTEEGSN